MTLSETDRRRHSREGESQAATLSDRRPATAVGGWWPPHHEHEAANPVGLPEGQPLGVCSPEGTQPRRWQGWRRGRIVRCTVCMYCTYVPEAVLLKEHAARGEGRGCWSVAILQAVRDLRCTYRHVSPQIPPPSQRGVRRLPVHRNRWSLAMALALFWPTRRGSTGPSDGRDYQNTRACFDGPASQEQVATVSRVCPVVTARNPML